MRRLELLARPGASGRLAIACAVVALLATASGCGDRLGGAATPTWAGEVASIVHRHCASCHRPGSAAPFSLLTYDEARRRARLMAEVVESRLMPPFLPERDYGSFRDAPGLTADEVRTLAHWSRSGAPAGDLARAPSPPVFRDGFELGRPDLVVEMPRAFELPGDGPDLYRNFLVPLALTPGTRVRALELDPGNRAVVHHAAILADATGAARQLEGRDPQPGYDEMVGGAAPGGHFAGWTPGRGAIVLEPGMPWAVEEDTDLVLQLHLMPSGRPETVRARVGLWLTDQPVVRRPVLVHLLATTLDIPAGERSYTARDEIVLPVEVEAFSVYPHAHYLGREVKAWAERPDGTVEPLLWIKRWSFDWQDEYRYTQPLRLPAGSTLRLDLVYDNSAANLANPSDPPRRVVWGPSSRDEMGDVWIKVAPLREEDRGRLEDTLRGHEHDRFREGYHLRVAVDPGDAEAHARLGIGLVQDGRHADALPHLEAALEQRPGAWDLNYNLGIALTVLGRRTEARERFETALRADPTDSRTHNAFAGALLAQGELEQAIEHYRRAVDLRASSADLRSNLGLALQRAGDAAGAEASYREALRLDPRHAMAQLNYGGLLSELGRHEEAIGMLEELLEREPERFDAHVNLARSLARTGRYQDAEHHLRRALEQRADAGEVHYLLGLTLARLGRLDEAIDALEAAVRFEPGHELARQDLLEVRAVAARRGNRGF